MAHEPRGDAFVTHDELCIGTYREEAIWTARADVLALEVFRSFPPAFLLISAKRKK